MTEFERERLYTRLATAWANAEGAALAAQLPAAETVPAEAVARTDARVHAARQAAPGAQRPSRPLRRTLAVVAGLAATVVLAVALLPTLRGGPGMQSEQPAGSAAHSTAAPVPGDDAPDMDGQVPGSAQSGAQLTPRPLPFPLPEGYTLLGGGTDGVYTLYTIQSPAGAAILLTLTEAGGMDAYNQYTPYTVNGVPCYGDEGANGGLLAFETGGLTCELASGEGLAPLLEFAQLVL